MLTDTDSLSSPADVHRVFVQLAKLVHDVEALPEQAQSDFWEEALKAPCIEVTAGTCSTAIIYKITAAMFGPQWIELAAGGVKDYYESLLSQMRDMTGGEWDILLDQKLKESPEGCFVKAVNLRSGAILTRGTLQRVKGSASLLEWNSNVYFSSKDITILDFD